MSVEEKAYVHAEAQLHFHQQVRAETILSLVKELERMDYGSFRAITRLTEMLSKSEENRVGEILEAVKAKMTVGGEAA